MKGNINEIWEKGSRVWCAKWVAKEVIGKSRGSMPEDIKQT